jgi:dipeptide/tripeptide permease
MIAHGGDQFNQSNPKQSKKLSTYFNAAYFAFSMGELFALTLLVWIQTHSGMDVGFGVSAAVMAMGLISLVSGNLYYRNKPPQGSIFTPIAQVMHLNPFLFNSCCFARAPNELHLLEMHVLPFIISA